MLWAECLERLRKHVSDNHFTMWIRPLEAEEHSDCLKLYVPSPYWKSHIEKDYHEIISIMAEQISEGRVRQVEVLVGSSPGKDILTKQETPATTTSALQSPPVIPKATSNDTAKPAKVRQLNPALNFNLFVEGRSNQMAADACRKVLTKLGADDHNPLFLYGPTGLGKTHLMQAVGNALLQLKPNAKVMYMTAESFVQDFVSALQRKKIEEFKKNCRSLDLMLVDDIHLLAGK